MSRNPLDLGCLRLFAAAARHENLSRAAEAQGKTQPALSYRIREMEQRLGAALFERRHRGLALTPAGRDLQRAVEAALAELDRTASSIMADPEGGRVRLATDYAFAALWLMPRVGAFRAAHPGCELEIVASQELSAVLAGDADLAVRFGSRRDVGPAAERLMAERVVALCSPGFLAERGPFETAERLAAAPLLHLEARDRERWFDWDGWLAGLGVARRPGTPSLSFNSYSLVVQAAVAGQGVALGWLGLVDDLLEAGALVRAHPAVRESDCGYWLIEGSGRSDGATRAAAWIRNACAPTAP